MSNATESKITATVIPTHPEWCAESLDDAEHPPADPYHRTEALHVDVQRFEVGFSLTLTQRDEHLGPDWFGNGGPPSASGGVRDIGAPVLAFTMNNRESDERAGCDLTAGETEHLIAMLQRGLSDLRAVERVATSDAVVSEERRAAVTLGWAPR